MHRFFLILLSLSLLTACSKDEPLAPYTTAEKLLEDIDFQGYAIITKNGEDLVRKGYGLANKSSNMAQGTDVEYRIASVSKTLTGAAVVQLKRDGLIDSFDQTLDEFDADFPNGNQISIHQLLSHQSGLPDFQFFAEDAYEEGTYLNPNQIYDILTDMIEEDGLNFQPGESKQYSNSNFLVAALLIEQLSGSTYHEYVQEHILMPLGMSQTHKGADEINENTHAEGYLKRIPISFYPMGIALGAGDFSSTPSDMEKWTDAVKTDWFTAEEKAEVFAEDVPSGYVDFGMAWFTSQEGATTMYWHGGDLNGYWSMIGFIPEYDATIVLLSNQENEDDDENQRNTIIEQLMQFEYIN